MESGIQMSAGIPTSVPAKPFAATPTMVNGCPFTCTARPTTAGWEANVRLQNDSLITDRVRARRPVVF
jgi:hypothetical protein